MNATPFPVAHSLLAASALAERIAPLYDLDELVSYAVRTHGLNDNYLVTTASARYMLRVSPAHDADRHFGRGREEIACELALLEHLDRAGVPVAKPVTTRGGDRIVTLAAPEGERHGVLFTYAPGESLTPPRQTPDTAYQYGRAVATLHNAANGFKLPCTVHPLDRESLIERPLATCAPLLSDRPDDLRELRSVAAVLSAYMERLAADGADMGACHGDMQGGNANLTGEGVITFYDFEYCGPGLRAYDIAVFRWGAALGIARLGWTQEVVKRLWEAYLRGYEEIRPLRSLDRAAIPALVAVRELWYLGMQAVSWEHSGPPHDPDAFFDRELRFLREWRAIMRVSGDHNAV